jgi:hypothetical protein
VGLAFGGILGGLKFYYRPAIYSPDRRYRVEGSSYSS